MLRVTVADGQSRYLCDRLDFAERQTRRIQIAIGECWSRRVACSQAGIENAAALHTLRWPHRALRKDVPFKVAVVARIGVNDAADSSVFGSYLRLDASPASPITRQHN